MSPHRRAASRAILMRLAAEKDPVPLWDLSCIADAAARAAGRKKWDLFPSLYHYENLLPPDWTTRWLRTEGGSDSMLMACPRSWTPGSSVSRQLLLGGGVLVYSTGEVDI